MYLYLVQHGEALSKEEDPSRSLSSKGSEDIRKVAEFVSKLNITAEQILHSGKTRAFQTARILKERIAGDADIRETEGLAPMDEPETWLARLTGMKGNIILVGHLPHLGRLVKLLVCGNKEKDMISFETGCMVCMQRSGDGNWTLDWLIKPGMLT
jgi:phosphohistidine phosphatase